MAGLSTSAAFLGQLSIVMVKPVQGHTTTVDELGNARLAQAGANLIRCIKMWSSRILLRQERRMAKLS